MGAELTREMSGGESGLAGASLPANLDHTHLIQGCQSLSETFRKLQGRTVDISLVDESTIYGATVLGNTYSGQSHPDNLFILVSDGRETSLVNTGAIARLVIHPHRSA